MTTVQMVMVTLLVKQNEQKIVILPNIKEAYNYISDHIKTTNHLFIDFQFAKIYNSNCIGHIYHEKDGWKLATLDFVRVEVTDNNSKIQIIKES